jgi:CheY-like chemotaxis protein
MSRPVSSDPKNAVGGRRLLVVEDDYLIATELSESLQTLGLEVVGPVPSVAEALERIETAGKLDGAVLDINLGAQRVFPVADALAERAVPFVFLTGYDPGVIPQAHSAALCCQKPVDTSLLIRALTKVGAV